MTVQPASPAPDGSAPETWAAPKQPLLKSIVRRTISPDVRYVVRQRIMEAPLLSEAFVRIDPSVANARVTRETRIVIDGFPRSGNTYSRAAFQVANGPDVPISTHGHSHRFAQLGVKHGIPVITLIREPRAPLASILAFTREVSPHVLVRSYCRYYEAILPIIDDVVIAPFPAVIGDFGLIIDQVNAKWGTSFARYEKTEANEKAATAIVEAETRAVIGPQHFEAVVPRPSAQRSSREEALAGLSARDLAELDRATALYDKIVGHAAR